MVLQRVVLSLFVTTTLVGCAAQRQAPFHVYQSPLLAAEMETPRPTNRSFDPAQPGDWSIDSEQVVAQSSSSLKTDNTKLKKAKKRRKKGGFPSLSTRSGVGGHDDSGSSSAERGDFAPALAAAYAHKTLAVNGVTFPDEARVSIAKFWDACKTRGKTHQGTPMPGDAVFFHNAVDANADGRNNDWYTHIGIVESVDAQGTASFLSWRGGQVVKLQANLKTPDAPNLNSQLRVPSADDAPFTQYHTGQLFAGWCTALDAKRDVIVMDSWRPDVR